MRCHECVYEYRCGEGLNCGGFSLEEMRARYSPELRPLFDAAAEVEAEGYLKLTRIEEFALLATKLGARRVGLAFCIGSAEETAVIAGYLERRGFEVSSVCCKLGGMPKEELGHSPVPGSSVDTSCNPLGQAAQLELDGVDIIGSISLCVGHDALLGLGSTIPVVTLIAKDRVTGHNPAAVVYNRYLRRRLK
ncbi:DUF1847 domain-containing protein [bacterium]|nr:DUF1847 domain-containing protein [bacterium]